MTINWNNSNETKRTLYFSDLKLGQSFRNAGPYSQNAVYTKILEEESGDYKMLELATLTAWTPTKSPVEIVEVEVNIKAAKPSIY